MTINPFSILGLIMSLFLLFTTRGNQKRSDFIINAFMSGAFFYSQIMPHYDPTMKLFILLAHAVICMGALVGGVVGALLPKISNGLALGTLTTIAISVPLMSENTDDTTFYTSVSSLFVAAIIIGIYLTQKFPTCSDGVRSSLATGLLFSLSVDVTYKEGLLSALTYLLSMKVPSYYCFDECSVSFMLSIWGAISLLCFVVNGYYVNCFTKHSQTNGSYSPLASSEVKAMYTQKTLHYLDTNVYNHFDPDNVPAPMKNIADIVYLIAHRLSEQHGFQIDSSRNQAEHAMMLLTNESKSSADNALLGPSSRVHAQLFMNYKKWCHHMGTPPLFVRKEPGKFYAAFIEDIMMFLLIWGEAANLKHTPECMCYLYHKSMEEHLKSYGSNNNGVSTRVSVPRGYFLDMVVTPLYDVVSAGMKQGKDHFERKTYDDFNEFFWSPDCLKYSIYEHVDDNNCEDLLSSDSYIHVARALKAAKKTYVEKRSWLHPLLSMRRIFEWHVITFTLLTGWAFASELVWTHNFTLQVMSFAFWVVTFLSLLWTCLEVWVLYPQTTISGPSICGYLIRLLVGYIVLVYQSMYYHWSFRTDADPGSSSMMSQGSAIFWWWQFVWISLASQVFYWLESILCWFPFITTALLSWNNDFFQAILNICYPFSQLYVGKTSSIVQNKVFTYAFFWVTLLTFKLWFGFRFIVHPVTIPSIELYDDYMNFQRISFLKTSTLMIVWWFPHFVVYLIDLAIWYSVWISVAGGFVALFERQGAVRDSRTFRSHFIRSPLAFSQKILPDTSVVRQKSSGMVASTASLTDLLLRPKENTVPATHGHHTATNSITSAGSSSTHPTATTGASKNTLSSSRAKSSANFQDFQFQSASSAGRTQEIDEESTESYSYQQEPSELNNLALQSNVNGFLDIRSQRWTIFAKVWNEIISRLRIADHLSDVEVDVMVFTHFDWLTKPVYLPLYQTAGCIEATVYTFKEAVVEYNNEKEPVQKIAVIEKFHHAIDTSAQEAIGEIWELFTWLLQKVLGPAHKADVITITHKLHSWASSNDLFGKMSVDNLSTMVTHATNIVSSLKGCLKKRKSSPVVTPAVLAKAEEVSKSQLSSDQQTPPSAVASSKPTVIKPAPVSMKKSNSTGFLAGLAEQGESFANTTKTKALKFSKVVPFKKQVLVITDTVRDKVRDEIRNLFHKLKEALRPKKNTNAAGMTITNDSQDVINCITFVMSFESGFMWNDEYASSQIDEIAKDPRVLPVMNKAHGLFNLRVTQVDPASPEALRRLHFFINSLFMDIPVSPSIKYSKEYTCLTPYYSEDVLLTRDDLEAKNSDGVSTILYLQTLYKKDWLNFLERRGITSDESLAWAREHHQETRIWASLRAQTLFRTVDGMMYTEAAVRLLAEIEQISHEDTDVLAKLKFNYVVACQVYGQMKKGLDHKADDIEFLLSRHPNLRVAYIDTSRVNKDGDMAFYSVLIKHDTADHTVKEVYRVKLPGNPVLGEGKPENQNHAIVFSRGRYLQAIDMNQDGYFEEAIKMRNLLQEFDSGCAILGFREHIFTGSISSVANYMALQELSFVTLGQRVLNNPLCIRQHYGHPDLFDKFFVMTEGGMSKASKGINLSEDVFAGFNATIRGRTVNFKEYVQTGKGRDMGLQQTYKFEAKLSQGNSEQSISRDMSRICDRLDFFRLMSFYYGGIGHYMANTMVIFALVMVVYCMLGLSIFQEEGVNERPMLPEGLLQMALAGLGILQTGPLIVTLTVEKGFFSSLSEIAFMIISGGPLYFIFHIQTKCYYFQQTLLAGDAKYRPTGRGFVIRHSPFDENFRFFASSHIYLGFELMVALLLLSLYTSSKQYIGLTWSLWMTVIAFVFGPFWFNPVTFQWSKLHTDYLQWINWMTEVGGTSEQSWESWWKEENGFYKHLSPSWRVFLIVQKCFLWTFIAYGLAGTKFVDDEDETVKVGQVLVLYVLFFFGNWCISKLEKTLSYGMRRFASLLLSSVVIVVTVYLFATHLAYVRYTIAIYYFGASLTFLGLVTGLVPVQFVYKIHDYIVGHVIFLILGITTVLQLGHVQTWLLYHNALSSGVVVDDILKYATRTKERALDDRNVIADLKAQVAEQAAAIKHLLEYKKDGSRDAYDHHEGGGGVNGNKNVELVPLLNGNRKHASAVVDETTNKFNTKGSTAYGSAGTTSSRPHGVSINESASKAAATAAVPIIISNIPAFGVHSTAKTGPGVITKAADTSVSTSAPKSTLRDLVKVIPPAISKSAVSDSPTQHQQSNLSLPGIKDSADVQNIVTSPHISSNHPSSAPSSNKSNSTSVMMPASSASDSSGFRREHSTDSLGPSSGGNAVRAVNSSGDFVFKQPDKFPVRDPKR